MSTYKPTVNFTKAQLDAIYADRRSLVVSAAAGSGKTAVLSDRILKRILDDDDPGDIGRFLIVTFTRAAAGELKDRLYKKIEKACREFPKNKRLNAQLDGVSNARISTIHSFCFDTVKLCFYDLGLPQDIRIATSTEIDLIKSRVLRDVIEAYYKGSSEDFKISSHDREGFILLSDICSNGKNDEGIIDALNDIYEKMISYPLPVNMLVNNCEELESEIEKCENDEMSVYDTYFFSHLFSAARSLAKEAKTLITAAREMSRKDQILFEKYDATLYTEEVFFSFCENEFYPENIDRLIAERNSNQKTKMPVVRGYKSPLKDSILKIRKDAHAALDKAFNTVFSREEDEILQEMRDTLRLRRVITALLRDFMTLFASEKLKRRIVDFSDLEHYAFNALVEKDSFDVKTGAFKKTEHAKRLTNELDEIYVDEYQDTNMLQDAIFRAVSREDNLFTVGDVKQSIYSFRGAAPQVFTKRSDSFEDYVDNEDGKKASRIFLSNNFRSDSHCIDIVNEIFDIVMNPDGAQEYSENERLIFSKNKDSLLDNEIYIIDSSSDHGEYTEEESEETDESVNAEALLIAQRIEKLMSEGLTTESGEALKYSDIAVLVRKNPHLTLLKNVLSSRGIPVFAEDKSSSFISSAEILFFISLLCTIDNPLRDIYLIGTMASPIYDFSSDELYEIRKSRKGRFFYNALKEYAFSEGEANEKYPFLKEKARRFLAQLEEYRGYSLKNKVSDTVRLLLDSTEILTAWPCESDEIRDKRRTDLLFLFNIAISFDSCNDGGISEFCDYVLNLSSDEMPSTESGSDAVKLMTIHKSKGLEFPVCFVSMTGSKFANKEIAKQIITDADIGPSFRLISEDGLAKVNTSIRKACTEKITKEGIREEKRVLYVALTRPKQKLIITGTKRSLPTVFPKDFAREMGKANADKANNHLDMILSGLSLNDTYRTAMEQYAQARTFTSAAEGGLEVNIIHSSDIQSRDLNELRSKNTVGLLKEAEASDDKPKPVEAKWEEKVYTKDDLDKSLLDTLDYVYPYHSDVFMPAKVSVSDINRANSADSDIQNGTIIGSASIPDLAIPKRLTKEKKRGGAFKGIAMHEFMQFASFKSVSENGTRAEAERLVREGYISKEKADVIDHERLKEFFSSSLFKRMTDSEMLKREMRFNVFLSPEEIFTDNVDFSGNSRDAEILVQGVIDCFFLNEEKGYTLMDYKTDYVPFGGEEILIDRYKDQLRIYKTAVEKMVKGKVSEILIYSFALNKPIRLDI